MPAPAEMPRPREIEISPLESPDCWLGPVRLQTHLRAGNCNNGGSNALIRQYEAIVSCNTVAFGVYPQLSFGCLKWFPFPDWPG